MGPPMPPQGYTPNQGHMPDGYHGGQMYQGMPQHYNSPYINPNQSGDYQQGPYGNPQGYNPYYRGQQNMPMGNMGMPGQMFPGANMPQGMQHSPRNQQVQQQQQQSPQQVADNILQMASSGCVSPASQFRTPGPVISPQLGHKQMTSPTMRQPGPYMYPNQTQMAVQNRNSPISPMQARSPASVHSGHSMHSISPGPQPSPAASQPSPGLHNIKSPSGQPVHRSPANTQAPSITSPAQAVPPMASPMQSSGNSIVGNQPSPSGYASSVCSPVHSAPGHFSPNDPPINSPANSSPNYPMCSLPRNNQPVSSPYIDSHSTSVQPYVTTPSGSGQSLSNPLQSLQKLVMLPESQVVDPKSVVNDGSISGEGCPKNDEGGELATPASSPKICLDGRHCGSDNENFQQEFPSSKPKEEPQVVSMPSYSGNPAYIAAPRCLESQFNQSVDSYYEPMGFHEAPQRYKYEPQMSNPNYAQHPYMGNYESHIRHPVLTNYDERTDQSFVENNISLPPKKKQKRTRKTEKAECGKRNKNKKKQSQDTDSCGNAESTVCNTSSTNALNAGQNQNDTNCLTKDPNTPPKANPHSNFGNNSPSKFKNQELHKNNSNERDKVKDAKEREAEYDFTDEEDTKSQIGSKEKCQSPSSHAKENCSVNSTIRHSPHKCGDGLVSNKIKKRATYSRENYLGSLEDRSMVNDFDVVLDNCVTNSTFRTINGDALSTVHRNGALLTRVNAEILPSSCLSRLKVRKSAVRTLTNCSTTHSESKLNSQLKTKKKSHVQNSKLCESDGEIYSSDPDDYLFPLAEQTSQITVRNTGKVGKKRGRPKRDLQLQVSPSHHDQENKPNCLKTKIHKNAVEDNISVHVNQVTSSKYKSAKATGKSDSEKSPRSDRSENIETEICSKENEARNENSVEKVRGTKAETSCTGSMKTTGTESVSTEKVADTRKVCQEDKKVSPNSTVPSSEVTPESGKKKRGRPFGSKNKFKCTRRRRKGIQENTDLDPLPSGSENFKSMKFKKTLDLVAEHSKVNRKRKHADVKKERLTGPYIKAKGPNDNPTTFEVVNIPDFENDKLNQKKKARTGDFSEKPASLPPVSSLDQRIPFLCALCGQASNYQMLGDLFGPYFKETASPPDEMKSLNQDSKSKDDECDRKRKKQKSDDKRVRKQSLSGGNGDCVPAEIWVHEDCAVWSHGVYLHGRKVHGLEDAISVAKQSVSNQKFYRCFVFLIYYKSYLTKKHACITVSEAGIYLVD